MIGRPVRLRVFEGLSFFGVRALERTSPLFIVIGRPVRLRVFEGLSFFGVRALERTSPLFIVKVLISPEIMHRKDAQCNTMK